MRSASTLRAAGFLVCAIGLLHCGQEQPSRISGQPELRTEEEKTLYAIGVAVAENTVGSFKGQLDADQMAKIVAGFADVLEGAEPRVSMEEYGPRLNAYLQNLSEAHWAAEATAQKEVGSAYLEAAAAEEGAIRTESGMVYQELVAGTGPTPSMNDSVRVHFHGKLTDGTVFSSSVEHGEPIVHAVSGFIPGWQEGLSMMRVGGKARLILPPELAYGDRPVGEIPAGSTLIFELELLGIE